MRHRRFAALLGALLVVALTPQPPAHAATTLRASKVSLSVSTTAPTVGSMVKFGVSVPRGKFSAGDKVVIERRTGSSWRSIASRRLSPAGAASATNRPALGVNHYRVVKARTKKFSRTVSRTVTVRATAAPVPPSGPEVAVNGTGRTVTVTDVGRVAKATFSVSAGATVAVSTADIVGMDEAAVTVVDGTGAPVRLVSLGNGDIRSRWTFVSPRAGRYTVSVAASRGKPGSVRLVVTTPHTQLVALDGPSQALPAVPLPGQELRAAFVAEAGEYVSYDAGSPVDWRPNGIRLIDDSTGRTVEAVTKDVNFGVWQAPHDGTYTLELEPYEAIAMSSAFSMSSTRAVPSEVNGNTIRAAVDRPGGAAVFAVPMVDGQFVSIGVTRSPTAPGGYLVAVVTPDNFPSDGVASPYDLHNLPVRSTGTYLLVVRGTDHATPKIDIDVTTPLVATMIPNGPPVPVSTAGRAGQSVEVDFTGKQDDVVSLAALDRVFGPTNPTRQVYNLVGVKDVRTGESIDPVHGHTLVWSLPHDGAYRLTWAPTSAYTMAFDLLLSRTSPEPLTVDGPPASVTIQRAGGARVFSFPVARKHVFDIAWGAADESRYRVTTFGALDEYTVRGSGTRAVTSHSDGTAFVVVTGPTGSSGAAPLRLSVRTADP